MSYDFRSSHQIVLFGEKKIEELFKDTANVITKNIYSIDENVFIEYDINQLAQNITKENQIPVNFKLSKESPLIERRMENVPSNERAFPRTGYRKVVMVDYEFNINGNVKLLIYQPKTFQNMRITVTLLYNALTFTIPTNYANINLTPELESDIKQTAIDYINKFEVNLNNVISDCNEFNSSMLSQVLSIIEKRKLEIDDKNRRNDRLNPFK